MSSFFSFSPKVEAIGDYYLISGINIKSLEYDFRNNFGTKVIFDRLFTKVSSRSVKIHKFFMVELNWVLDHLVSQKNKRTVSRYAVGMLKYKQLFDEIKEKTWIATTYQTWPQYDIDKALKKFVFGPKPDQRKFLETYSNIRNGYQLRGCLLDAATGSGKSFSSLVWSEMISEGKLVVLCPKNLVTSPWKLEIDKVYKTKVKYWSTLDGTDVMDHLDSKIFIIHKEQLRTGDWEGMVKQISKNGKEPIKVVVDESHNYNEPKSQQTQSLIKFCTLPGISDVLLMSGTPIKAQGRETFALFAIIDKFFTGVVRDQFTKMYGRDNSYLNEMLAHRLGRIKYTIAVIDGMETPPEPVDIKIKFDGIEQFTLNAIRAKMVEYITDRVAFYRVQLPTYQKDWQHYVDQYRIKVQRDEKDIADLDRYVEIVKKFQKYGYDNFSDAHLSKFASVVEKRIEEDLRKEELKYFRHIKSAVKYVGLKIRGEALGNVLGKARMEAVRATIEHANLPKIISSVKKKTLIYTSYVDVIKELESYFDRQGILSTSVHGDNSSEIDKIVTDFGNKVELNPLITTFATLREGKPMLMANQIILMNSPFRSFELKQTIARIYRRGQDEECFVWMLVLDTGSEENITSRSVDIMEWSKAQVEQLLGGGNLEQKYSMSVSLKAVGGMEHYEADEFDDSGYSLDDFHQHEFDNLVPIEEYVDRPDINRVVTKSLATIADLF